MATGFAVLWLHVVTRAAVTYCGYTVRAEGYYLQFGLCRIRKKNIYVTVASAGRLCLSWYSSVYLRQLGMLCSPLVFRHCLLRLAWSNSNVRTASLLPSVVSDPWCCSAIAHLPPFALQGFNRPLLVPLPPQSEQQGQRQPEKY